MKNLCFLAAPFSKNKLLTFGIFNESNIWAKVYHIWKIEVYGATKLGNIVFWNLFSKQMSAKSLKLFSPPTTKRQPCKVFAKLNGNHLLMASIFKLHEYQTFGLMQMHNMCKIWFANNIFSLWKRLVYD